MRLKQVRDRERENGKHQNNFYKNPHKDMEARTQCKIS